MKSRPTVKPKCTIISNPLDMDDKAIDELVEEGTKRIAELFYQLALDEIKRAKEEKQSPKPDSKK